MLDPLGIHVLPKHFYTPVPDITWLRKNPKSWKAPAPMTGVYWDLDDQLRWLRQICAPHYMEVAGGWVYRDIVTKSVGPGYGPVEAQVLHCFIRAKRPARVVEVGSGASTAVMLHAAGLNGIDDGQLGRTAITCIEPNPKAAFALISGITHIQDICQNVPSLTFETLAAGDLLFVDSSHSVKVGSELSRIYLEVIPKLKPGVFVHIHDIYLPYLYSRDALSSFFSPQETVLLLALLTHNPRLRVLCSMSALHYGRCTELGALLTDYHPQLNDEGLAAGNTMGRHFPSSLWLQTA